MSITRVTDKQVTYKQGAAGSVVQNLGDKLRESVSVLDFMSAAQIVDVQAGTLTLDVTAAIIAADTAACSGALGLDGITVVSQKRVHFPAGKYRVTNLTYRGAPWQGDGISNTFIYCYGSAVSCINAVGSASARKLLSVSDMCLDGSNSTTGSLGISIGWNQRSQGALSRVRIQYFPGPAIFFAEQTWMMSFYDVYCAYNANGIGSIGSAIVVSNALGAGSVLALNWYTLHLENNGFVGSGLGGGMEIGTGAAINWAFYGGTWEGNYGDAEVRFTDALEMHINGMYLEAEVAKVANGIVFAGASYGSVTNSRIAGEITQTGSAIKVMNTSSVHVCNCYSNIKWTYDISALDTATVTTSGNNVMLLFNVAAGANFPQGTWTPNVGGTATYTAQVGSWTRIGKRVTVQCTLIINVLGTGSTYVISGLPYPAAAGGSGVVSYFAGLASSFVFLAANVAGSTVQIVGLTAAAANIIGAPLVFTNGSRIDFSLSYLTT
jgi:hypothetical protein